MNRSAIVLIRDPECRNELSGALRRAGLEVYARPHAEGWTALLRSPGLCCVVIGQDLRDADPALIAAKIAADTGAPRVAEVQPDVALGKWQLALRDGDTAPVSGPAKLGDWLADQLSSAAHDGCVGGASSHSYEFSIHDDEDTRRVQRVRGTSSEMARIVDVVRTIAPTDSTVLFEGESGTGKDLFARLIHQRSRRSDRFLVAVNCGAIPAQLMESELFGHVRGAFTGADANKDGLCVTADGGTLFLDEIGEMPLEMQVKLLRFLQSGWLRPVGSTKAIKVDTRVIAATNRDLKEEVAAGRFRLDLYYRLNVIKIRLPALRERAVDIPGIVDGILERLAENGSPVRTFGADTLRVLQQHSWPGNIRELENVVERLQLLYPDREIPVAEVRQHLADINLQLPDFSALQGSAFQDLGMAATHAAEIVGSEPSFAAELSGETQEESLGYSPNWTLRELEEIHIRRVLHQYRGNKTQAAKALGINVKTLYNKMKAAGMRREDFLPAIQS